MRLFRIVENIRQLGWTNGLLYLAARALEQLSAGHVRIIRYYLVAQPIPALAEPTCRPSSRTPITFVEATDPLTQAFPRPPHVIARRFRDGNHCLVARSGDRFTGFLWLARDGYDEDEVRCRYELVRPAECVWDYDVYVEPDFRIGRTFARLWDTANRHLADTGVRWSFSRISAFNLASLQAHCRLGLQRLFSATFICLGNVQLALIGAAPYIHLSLSSQSRPALQLRPPRIPEKPQVTLANPR
jgi:hypothetical protein